MKSETVLKHIDGIITKNLSQKDFDATRQVLMSNSKRFKERLDEIFYKISDIEKIIDTRQRYTNLYIFYTDKRIIDLYKVEKMNLSKDPLMAYKKFIFKENLQNCTDRPFMYNQKYIKYLNV
jgi:hypothetical protein